jgi:hypothetical protein
MKIAAVFFRSLFLVCAIFLFSLLITSNVKAQSGPSDPEALPVRVYLVIYDPILESQGSIRLHSYFEAQGELSAGTLDPVGLSVQLKDHLEAKSHGKAKYQIVGQSIRDEWPMHVGGARYTDSTYISEYTADTYTKGNGDYNAIISDLGIVQKINSGEIDEVWLWGGPGFGWNESIMAGPGAYYINGGPLTGVNTTRAFVLMGLSHERTVETALESFGHRVEDVMAKIYGGWAFPYGPPPTEAPPILTAWDEFSAKTYDPTDVAGCGFAHGSLNNYTYDGVNNPNSYDTANLDYAESNCNDWYNFPWMTGESYSYNCEMWAGTGCTDNPDLNWMLWWYDHMPYKAGTYDGYATNWWRYIVDVDQYKTSGRIVSIANDLSEDIVEANWYHGYVTPADIPPGQSAITTMYSHDGPYEGRKEGSYTRWFQTNLKSEAWIGYKPQTAPHFDLTNKSLVFWAYSNVNNDYITGSPKVYLKTSDTSYYLYTPSGVPLDFSILRWQKYEIPVDGNSTWTRTTVGSPNIADINAIEFRAAPAATSYHGWFMHLDGLGFASNDTTAPTASITSPTGGNVTGTVAVETAVADNAAIKRVDFFVDGQYLQTDATKPYTFFWDTSGAGNGSHTLTVKAYDMSDNSVTSSGVGVNVGSGGSDTIFADGFESGNSSAWSSETDTENDLNVNSSAAIHGSSGLSVLIDNTTNMYVTNTTPENETRYRARFYLDPNSISMASNDGFTVMQGRDDSSSFQVLLTYTTSSGYRVRSAIYNDAASSTYGDNVPISDAPHSIEIDWKAATSAGANNGYITLWVDGIEQSNVTGVDNDTKRIDDVRLGAVQNIDSGTSGTFYIDDFESRESTYIGPISGGGTDLIFSNGFESGSTSAWSVESDSENDLTVTSAASMGGSWGLSALLDNVTEMYVADLNPANEARYRSRFYFDPNGITMANGDSFSIFSGRDASNSIFNIQLGYSSSTGYRVRTVIYDDAQASSYGSWVNITNDQHSLEVDWSSATSAGANNGYINFWIDGNSVSSQGSVNNDTRRIDAARMGAVANLDSGTSGTVYFDRFDSRKTEYIGP